MSDNTEQLDTQSALLQCRMSAACFDMCLQEAVSVGDLSTQSLSVEKAKDSQSEVRLMANFG